MPRAIAKGNGGGRGIGDGGGGGKGGGENREALKKDAAKREEERQRELTQRSEGKRKWEESGKYGDGDDGGLVEVRFVWAVMTVLEAVTYRAGMVTGNTVTGSRFTALRSTRESWSFRTWTWFERSPLETNLWVVFLFFATFAPGFSTNRRHRVIDSSSGALVRPGRTAQRASWVTPWGVDCWLFRSIKSSNEKSGTDDLEGESRAESDRREGDGAGENLHPTGKSALGRPEGKETKEQNTNTPRSPMVLRASRQAGSLASTSPSPETYPDAYAAWVEVETGDVEWSSSEPEEIERVQPHTRDAIRD
ncbi:hypothetical protein N7462_001136 [Penicillium macrosclerotiorum]|uniref:uncharacterized protein n=1 Tax=Penicillium macrosclerotiorum TaxID=303699 RepID=UPI00254968BD|nr:uncharacterized protein N7462_001136 [Penicillium macrosclerotiorum]KAJ5699131.1 hypothetical protein N7462_001136 [Penicillium macrosclerotiorum]